MGYCDDVCDNSEAAYLREHPFVISNGAFFGMIAVSITVGLSMVFLYIVR